MTEKDLAADMRTLLAALHDPDGLSTSHARAVQPAASHDETPPSVSLEDKLNKLLGALRSNDSDEWEGKPQQTDLGLRFCSCSEMGGSGLKGVSTGKNAEEDEEEGDDGTAARASLDNLMAEYLAVVGKARHAVHPPDA